MVLMGQASMGILGLYSSGSSGLMKGGLRGGRKAGVSRDSRPIIKAGCASRRLVGREDECGKVLWLYAPGSASLMKVGGEAIGE